MPQIITLGTGIVAILIFFLFVPDQVLIFLPIIGIITAIFTFVRIFDMPLPVFLYQITIFQFVRKIYLWRKNANTPSTTLFSEKTRETQGHQEKGMVPGAVITPQKSRLEKLKQDL